MTVLPPILKLETASDSVLLTDKTPEMSTFPLNDASPPTYNLRLKETSPLIIAVPLTSIVAFA